MAFDFKPDLDFQPGDAAAIDFQPEQVLPAFATRPEHLFTTPIGGGLIGGVPRVDIGEVPMAASASQIMSEALDKKLSMQAIKAVARSGVLAAGLPGHLMQYVGELDPPSYAKSVMALTGKAPEESDWLAKHGKRWADWIDERAQKGWLAPDLEIVNAKWSERPVSKAVVTIGESVVPYGLAIAAGAATRSPNVGLALMGTLEAGGAYHRQRAAGTGRRMARAIAVLSGAWEAATEKIPFDYIFKNQEKRLLRRLVTSGGLESVQELLASMGQNFLEHFGYHAKDWESVPAAVKEGMAHTFDGAIDAMVAGAGLGMMGTAVLGPAGPTAPPSVEAPVVQPAQGIPPVPVEGAPPAEAVAPAQPARPATETVAPEQPAQVETPVNLGSLTASEAAIAEQYGVTPGQGSYLKDAAEERYRALKHTPTEQRSRRDRRELAFLRRHRGDILALIDDQTSGKPVVKLPTPLVVAEARPSATPAQQPAVEKPTQVAPPLTPIDPDVVTRRAEERFQELKAKEQKTRQERKEYNFLRAHRDSVPDLVRDINADKPVTRLGLEPTVQKPERVKPRPKKTLLHLGHEIPVTLGMSDADRVNLMQEITGKESMADMSPQEKEAFVRHLEGLLGDQMTVAAPLVERVAQEIEALPPRENLKALAKTHPLLARAKNIGKAVKDFFFGEENTPIYHLARILGDTTAEIFDTGLRRGLRVSSAHKQNVHKRIVEFFRQHGITDEVAATLSESLDPRLTVTKGAKPKIRTHRVILRGKEYALTPAELLDAYLILGQEDGVRHAQGGGLVIDDVVTGALGDADIAQVQAAVNADPVLSAVVELFREIETSYWKQRLNETSMALERRNIATVKNWWGLDVKREKELAGKTARMIDVNLIENKGLLKDRTHSTLPVRVGDAFAKFVGFENAVAEYVGFAPELRAIRAVLNNQAIATAVRDKGYAGVRNRILTIMERAQGARHDRSTFGMFLQRMMPNIYRAYLYFNPRVIASQYTSAFVYWGYASPKYSQLLFKGLTPQAIRETLELSAIAWERATMGHSNVALGEAAKADVTLRMFTGKAAHANALGVGLKLADAAALAAGWEIAKAEYLDAQKGAIDGESALWWADKDVSAKADPADENWRRAVSERAEFLWQRTQPSWDKWNRSMMTGDPLRQFFFPFRTFHEKALTVLNEANLDYARSEHTADDKARMARKYGAVFASYTINATIRAMISAVLFRERKTIWELMSGTFTEVFQMFPILGKVLQNSIQQFTRVLLDNTASKEYNVISIMPVDLLNKMASLPEILTKAAAYMFSGDSARAETEAKRAMKVAYDAIGTAEGVPAPMLKRMYEGWAEDEDGAETGPRGPVRRTPPSRRPRR